ncbi:cytidylate kinase-like family protein [Clostridium sp. C8-1-8]|uniref:cytidylate kinase-like family protein n=1 Tax=Clostridium sp. C8-1-8 TaxID=2698831 RepID=UPI00136A5846|nr:cytidylate kinase-like family protein [Clostridium sp. C8-1-8]
MTKKYIVFTSEYASGARLIGKTLGEKLGIKFYGEEELLLKAAEESGIDEKVLRDYDRKLGNIKFDQSSTSNEDSIRFEDNLSRSIYNAYSDCIMKIVEEGSCILMERGADIILKGKVDFLNVYAYSKDMEKKIDRCERVGGIPKEDAPEHIAGQVMQRKVYYSLFSNIQRGKMSEYDLCINTDTFTSDALGMEKCAEIIKAAL